MFKSIFSGRKEAQDPVEKPDELTRAVTDKYLIFERKCHNYFHQYVPYFSGKDIFVAGGSIPRLYYDLPMRDIDIFVNNTADYRALYSEYVSSGYTQEVTKDEFVRFKHPSEDLLVELIHFHEPKSFSCVRNFDFSISKFMFFGEHGGLRTINYETSWIDLLEKRLTLRDDKFLKYREMIIRDKYGTPTEVNNIITRLLKYHELGFRLNDGQALYLYRTMLDFKNEK